jgi:peptide subunit release factor 1 (eRF1)
MYLDDIAEYIREGFDHRRVRHTKTVGTDHLGSASRAQRKADEQIRINLRRVIKDIDSMAREYEVRRIILAGSPEITAELRTLLPKRLDLLVIGTAEIASTASVEKIRKLAAPVARRFEQETERVLVRDLLTSAAKSAGVVIGFDDTLNAVNQRRVWRFVFAEGTHSRGFECPQCSALFSMAPPSCSFCGSAVDSTEDVVERAVDRAIRSGARIEVIREESAASSLNAAGGIGAFLRTRRNSVARKAGSGARQ